MVFTAGSIAGRSKIFIIDTVEAYRECRFLDQREIDAGYQEERVGRGRPARSCDRNPESESTRQGQCRASGVNA